MHSLCKNGKKNHLSGKYIAYKPFSSFADSAGLTAGTGFIVFRDEWDVSHA